MAAKLPVSIRPLSSNFEEIKVVSIIAGRTHSGGDQDDQDTVAGLARKDLLDMFSNANSKPTFLVAEADGKIAGFIGFMMSWTHWQAYEIFWVTVVPEFERCSVGTRLVNAALQEICKDQNARFVELKSKVPEYFGRFGFDVVNSFEEAPGVNVSVMHRHISR